jgi:HAE1 family hydrophobic/amphiphilic exporter-1
MSIARNVVNKPTTILIIYLIIVGLAVYVVSQIPIDLFPDIKFPMIVVYTTYGGAGPEQVEKMVTRPLEGALSNVSNLTEIRSTSYKGSSIVMLEFKWGEDLSEAANDVRDKLEFVKEYLPDEADTPQIFKFDPSMMPIMELSLQGNRPPEELYQLAENRIVPFLEQVPGVSMATIYGGREKVIKVEIPQNRLEAYDLSLTQVAGMLAAQNIQLGSGQVSEGTKNFLVQTTGEYSSVGEIETTVVAYKGLGMTPAGQMDPTKVILLRDIAHVYEGYDDVVSNVYVDGQPGLDISIQKQSGTNSVQTANNVYEKLEEIKGNLPPDVELKIIYDTTDMIRASLKGVTNSAILGGILAMVILFIFLRNMKSTFIIGLSIPISLLITLMLMYFFHLTLNLMTLAGLTLGIGMIVDSSIVILENVFRYREKGAKLGPSAIFGSQEMITAITASTLTTVCVFLPIVLFKRELDIIGVLFQDLAMTVVVSLMASLIIAITLVPVLSSKYLKLYTRKQRPLKNKTLRKIDSAFERFFTGMDNFYKKVLGYLLKNKSRTIMILVLILGISFLMIPVLGFDLFPSGGDPFVQLEVQLPVGTKLEITEDVMDQLVEIVEKEINYKQILVISGRGDGFFSVDNSHKGVITVSLPDFKERTDTSKDVQEKLREHFDDFPGVEFTFSSGMGSLGSSQPIDIVLKSEDMELAIAKGQEIVSILEDHVPILTEPMLDVEDVLPLVEVVIDREKAYALGLNVMSIGSEISASIDGKVATIFRHQGNEYDVVIELPEEDRNSIPDLNNIFVINSMGQKIPVSSFATLQKSTGPVSIRREDRTRAVHVLAGLRPGVRTNEAERMVRATISREYIPDDNVIVQYEGDYKEIIKYVKKFAIIMVLVVALVFGVMASLFESMKDPFIVFLSMPFLVVGIVFIYAVTGTSLSMFTAVGLIMLAGITVNNGIVLVDYTNLLRSRGLKIREACIEAGGNRLRPVLMTSLTTIFGMTPMAFSKGEGTDLVQPIGQSIVGGMIMSTLFTLLIVPLLYAIFNRKSVPKKMKLSWFNEKLETDRDLYAPLFEELKKYYHIKGDKILKRNKTITDDERTYVFNLLIDAEYRRFRLHKHA